MTHGFETLAIHAGQEPDPRTGAVVPPIFQTTTYAQDARRRTRGRATSTAAPRNPTRDALQECLAALEGGRRGLAFASPAWPPRTPCCVRVCQPGDHVVIPDDAYGGTFRLFAKVAERWGLSLDRGADVRRGRGPGGDATDATRAGLGGDADQPAAVGIADIAALARVAHDRGALLVVDNTFASPYLQQPLALGADVVVHSTTKYIGGHSDVVGGALVVRRRGARPTGWRSTRTRWARSTGRSTPG